MRVLIGGETSGVIRRAFRVRGHDAYSCDLLECQDNSEYHYQCDMFEILPLDSWDLFIVHPDCTFLTSSGLHWNKRIAGREQATLKALDFVRRCLDVPKNYKVRRLCLENPPGRIGTAICKADQYVQPYQFGDDASKKTGLWLYNLPPLKIDPAKRCPGRIVKSGPYAGKERWSNQTDSGQNNLGPSADRWQLRAETYPGIAAAMAEQWGILD